MKWRDSTAWVDGFDPTKIPDEDLDYAYTEAKRSHRFLTAELEGETDPHRLRILTDERKRLATIAWRLKDRGAYDLSKGN